MVTTAEQLLDAAERRIRDAGYNGCSFRDLAADVGIKSSSVHHHFPTKGALAAAVAVRYTERFLKTIDTCGEAEPIEAYRLAFRGSLVNDERMCLCGVLAAEAGGLPGEVASATKDFFARCVADLTRRLGGLPTSARSAMTVMATLEGAMLLARAFGAIKAFDEATAGLGLAADRTREFTEQLRIAGVPV